MLAFIMRLLLQNKNKVQYKNTNSGRRNLLNVKSHIEKIGFELVLKNNTVWYGVQFWGRNFSVGGSTCYHHMLLGL